MCIKKLFRKNKDVKVVYGNSIAIYEGKIKWVNETLCATAITPYDYFNYGDKDTR